MVESLLQRLTKRRSQAFRKPVDVHSDSYDAGESIFSGIIWNIVNQLGKQHFSCGLVVNNLKERKLFSDVRNRNHNQSVHERTLTHLALLETHKIH